MTLVRDRPVLAHLAWAVAWCVPGMWSAHRIDTLEGLATIPWPVGAVVMIALTVGLNATGLWTERAAGGSWSRVRLMGWWLPPATLLVPPLLPSLG